MDNIMVENFGYEGKLKLSLVDGENVIKVQEVNNSGTDMLFSFFSYCLMGELEIASLYRPTKIRLLRVIYDDASGEELGLEAASGYIYLKSKPERVFNSQIEAQAVKLSFMVPRSLIDSTGFNRIALYPHFAGNEGEDDLPNYSAYCDISSITGGIAGVEGLSSWTISSVLLVDWEMTISNKITKIKDKSTIGGTN
jgi:hypothetical protein